MTTGFDASAAGVMACPAFVMMPASLIREGAPNSALRAMIALATFGGCEKIYPLQAELAKRAGVTDRTLRSGLRWLEEHDYVRTEYRSGTSSVYHVRTTDAPFGPEAPAKAPRKPRTAPSAASGAPVVESAAHVDDWAPPMVESPAEDMFQDDVLDALGASAAPDALYWDESFSAPEPPSEDPVEVIDAEIIEDEPIASPTDTDRHRRSQAARKAEADALDADFEEFYAAYPRHVGKAAARKAYKAASKAGADPVDLVKRARLYAIQREGQDPKYTAHPATWLNQGRWEDDIEVTPSMSMEMAIQEFASTGTDPAASGEDFDPWEDDDVPEGYIRNKNGVLVEDIVGNYLRARESGNPPAPMPRPEPERSASSPEAISEAIARAREAAGPVIHHRKQSWKK